MLKAMKLNAKVNRVPADAGPLVVTARHAHGGWCPTCRSGQTIVLTGRDFQAAWCGSCVEIIDLATLDSATGSLRVSRRAIRRWVHDARAHLFETIEGVVLVLLQPATAR